MSLNGAKLWQGCLKMKSKKVFYLLIFSLLSTLVACSDSSKQIKETAESRTEPSATTPCDPELFQKTNEETQSTELNKESN